MIEKGEMDRKVDKSELPTNTNAKEESEKYLSAIPSHF